MTLKARLAELAKAINDVPATSLDVRRDDYAREVLGRASDLIPPLALLLQAYVDDDVTEETLERAWTVLRELEKRLQ